MNLPEESKCPKNKLHHFRSTREYSDAFLETCEFCSKNIIWKKDSQGRIDNRKYLRFHIRELCQPWGETAKFFALAYGEERYRDAIKSKPVSKALNWEEAGEDARTMVRELKKEKTIV